MVSTSQRRPFRKRLLDFLLYIAISILLIGVLSFVSIAHRGLDWKWLGLSVNTALVFGFLVYWFRNQWRSFRFWSVLLALLVIHCLVLVIFLQRIDKFPLSWYVLLNSAEWYLMVGILIRLRFRMSDKSDI